MIPIRKIPAAIRIARQGGIRKLGRAIASYYAPTPDTEPHLQMLQQRENLVVAEVGVWKGANAYRLYEKLDIEKMYLIDPYDEYEGYDERKSDTEVMMEAKKEAHRRLDGLNSIIWMEEFSAMFRCLKSPV